MFGGQRRIDERKWAELVRVNTDEKESTAMESRPEARFDANMWVCSDETQIKTRSS